MAEPSAADAGGLNHKYLRLQDLRRLKNVFFSSRRVVEGQYAGRHSSPQRGHSVEFNDYRQYMAGDEIGDVDWKVYARSDKMFVKLFEHQSDMTVNLVVDASASMAYGGLRSGHRKYDQACMMAAAIAFLTTQQQDRISFGLAQGGLHQFHRPYGAFTHLLGILKTMEQVVPQGQANLAEALRRTAALIGRRGLLGVFSDLLDDQQAILDAMAVFTHRGSEVILFHILHADELKLPSMQEAIFRDSETLAAMGLHVEDVRKEYEQRLSRYLETWATACRGRGIDYNLVSTAVNYSQALAHYLYQRAGMM